MPGSLFERLTMGADGMALDDDESIRNHLLRMLTTRKGAVQALPEYGLPDLNDLTLSRSELMHMCCRAIEECITNYEPRLTSPQVTAFSMESSSPFSMGFDIKAMKVAADGEVRPWSWSLTMEGEKFRGGR